VHGLIRRVLPAFEPLWQDLFMALRLAGLAVLLLGLFGLWLVFHADELGLGKYGGIGADQMVMAATCLLVQFVGLLMLIAKRR
jgi:hypothetical protein